MAVRNKLAGGTRDLKSTDPVDFSDMNDTLNAIVVSGAVESLQANIQTDKATQGAFDNNNLVAIDRFTKQSGAHDTVDLAFTTARFSGIEDYYFSPDSATTKLVTIPLFYKEERRDNIIVHTESSALPNSSIKVRAIEMRDAVANTYSTLVNLPEKLAGACVVAGENNDLYIFGGYDTDNNIARKKAYRYNLLDGTYTRLADMTVALEARHDEAQFEGVILGNNIHLQFHQANTHHAYIYDTANDSYSSDVSGHSSHQYSFAMTKIGNFIYAFSVFYNGAEYVRKYTPKNGNVPASWSNIHTNIPGHNNNNDGAITSDNTKYLYIFQHNYLWRLDITDNTLTSLTTCPVGSEDPTIHYYNNKIYMFNDSRAFPHIYDITAETWSTGLARDPDTYDSAMVGHGPFFYFLGGYDRSNSNLGTNKTYRYSITNAEIPTNGAASPEIDLSTTKNGILDVSSFGDLKKIGFEFTLKSDLNKKPVIRNYGFDYVWSL
jgi:hypothetical protein